MSAGRDAGIRGFSPGWLKESPKRALPDGVGDVLAARQLLLDLPGDEVSHLLLGVFRHVAELQPVAAAILHPDPDSTLPLAAREVQE